MDAGYDDDRKDLMDDYNSIEIISVMPANDDANAYRDVVLLHTQSLRQENLRCCFIVGYIQVMPGGDVSNGQFHDDDVD